MNDRKRLTWLITLALCIKASLPAASQSGNGYDLTRHTIDNGGVTFSTSNGYRLGGTIGQPDVGTLSSGNYTLVGGFWQSSGSSEPPEHHIYLPLVLRTN